MGRGVKKSRFVLVKVLLFLLVAIPFALSLGCGDPEQPPYGVEVLMGDDITIESTINTYVYLSALVVDADELPLNGMEVRFLCSAYEEDALLVELDRYGEFVRTLGDPYYENTSEVGVVEVHVWISGDFEGEFTVSATVGEGLAGDSVLIKKTIPEL